jgi:phage terminase small subunit
MRGRKPTPREERIRQGNTQHRPLPEPLLVAGRPDLGELAEPPDHLPEDAKALWRDSVERLIEVSSRRSALNTPGFARPNG